MAPITTPLGEMFMFTVEGEGLAGRAAQRAGLGDPARPALCRRRGRCQCLGGKVRSFEVLPDPVKLAAVGLSTAQIKTAIEANNRNDGAGRLGEGDEVLLVRTEGSIKTQDDLRAIVVKNDKGMAVRLGDVAQVREGSVTRYGVVTKDGRGEAVEGLVLGLAGANAQKVVEGVTKKLEDLKPTLPKGIEIKVFYNRASWSRRPWARSRRR
jgi:cobalt-zinc-cadmium resistance protein CzcA